MDAAMVAVVAALVAAMLYVGVVVPFDVLGGCRFNHPSLSRMG
jgi:hypothetical protein